MTERVEDYMPLDPHGTPPRPRPNERVEEIRRQEDDRAYARRIVRAHQHAHGPAQVRPAPEKCPECRDLIDAITHALGTKATALAQAERERDGETLRANTYLNKIKELRAEVERLKKSLDHWKDCHGTTADALVTAEAALARVRAALEEIKKEATEVRSGLISFARRNTLAGFVQAIAWAALEGRG